MSPINFEHFAQVHTLAKKSLIKSLQHFAPFSGVRRFWTFWTVLDVKNETLIMQIRLLFINYLCIKASPTTQNIASVRTIGCFVANSARRSSNSFVQVELTIIRRLSQVNQFSLAHGELSPTFSPQPFLRLEWNLRNRLFFGAYHPYFYQISSSSPELTFDISSSSNHPLE